MEIELWLAEWCARELGAAPVEVLFEASVVSAVWGLRLGDGREVVVKARLDDGRVGTCLAVQGAVVAAGLPCARPLTGVSVVDGRAVHAEEWLPGGEVARGNDAGTAKRSARLYAAVMGVTRRLQHPPPLPNPEWVRWDHDGPGEWPPNAVHDTRPGADSLRADLVAIATRARRRLLKAGSMRPVLGHADWEAQNLRWHEHPRPPRPPLGEPPSSMDIHAVGGLPTDFLRGQPPNSRGQLLQEFQLGEGDGGGEG